LSAFIATKLTTLYTALITTLVTSLYPTIYISLIATIKETYKPAIFPTFSISYNTANLFALIAAFKTTNFSTNAPTVYTTLDFSLFAAVESALTADHST
jgi:hypothetical protein